MKEVNFLNLDIKELYEKGKQTLETELGEILYEGDERLILFQNLFQIQVGEQANINDAARQNLLRYARGEYLDALGEDFYFTKRLQAQKATCKVKITLSKANNEEDTVIKKGTRITPDRVLFFENMGDITIPKGELEGEGKYIAQEPGSKYSGIGKGLIKYMVDVLPFVKSIENLDETSGGTDTETDDEYRERCRASKNAVSVAGPEDSYRYFAMSAHAAIVDAVPTMPTPGTVKIILLLEDGTEANEDIKNRVLAECSQKNRRPLTDKVEVASAETEPYNINLTYYLDKNQGTEERRYKKNIQGENLDNKEGDIRDYIKWQQNTLGREISPDELRYKIQDAATYTTTDNKKFTAVRRVEITEPQYKKIDPLKIGKVGTINVVYGGLE